MKFWSRTELHLTVCHRRPDRSFFYKGKQFPLCARCTGTVLGFLTLPLFGFQAVKLTLLQVGLLLLPAWIDGMTQALGWRESNNWLRLLTGLLLGVAQMGLVAITGDFLLEKLGFIRQ
ncbi:MAG: DUF2085 domain-containing protein [Bacteroidota bacterium]